MMTPPLIPEKNATVEPEFLIIYLSNKGEDRLLSTSQNIIFEQKDFEITNLASDVEKK
jgi:hypothetical protein